MPGSQSYRGFTFILFIKVKRFINNKPIYDFKKMLIGKILNV